MKKATLTLLMLVAFSYLYHANSKDMTKIGKSQRVHGYSKHPLYKIYCNMMSRCYNPGMDRYKNYGGRGIKVCDEWKERGDEFVKWGLSNGWQPGLSIERINIDGDYSPDNCKFIPIGQQYLNKTTTKLITVDGVTKPFRAWARFYGMDQGTLHYQMKKRPIEYCLVNKTQSKE